MIVAEETWEEEFGSSWWDCAEHILNGAATGGAAGAFTGAGIGFLWFDLPSGGFSLGAGAATGGVIGGLVGSLSGGYIGYKAYSKCH